MENIHGRRVTQSISNYSTGGNFHMGWKTITGGIVGVLGWAFAQEPITVETVVQGLGMILGIVGARHAVAKQVNKP